MADFPKKQQQCLIPKYLLDYTRELNQNHPDPSDPWGGGGGSPIEAGTGIEITGDETKTISIDTEVVPVKTDLSTVATTGDYDDLLNKPTIPDAVSGTNDGTNWTSLTVGNDTYAIPQASGSSIEIAEVIYLNGNYTITSSELAKITNNFPNVIVKLVTYSDRNDRNYYAPVRGVYDSDNSRYSYMIFAYTSVSGMTVTSQLTFTYDDNDNQYVITRSIGYATGNYENLSNKPSIPTKTSDLTNDSGFITSSALSNYVTSSQLSSALSDYALSSDVTTLASLVSSNTSRISALESGISDCVTLSQLSTTLADYALSSTVTSLASLVSSNTSAISDLTSQVGNCVTLSQLSTTLADYATVSSLSSYATLADLPPVVSGTNNGTNWTAITIGSDTYSIPQGGGSTPTNMVTTNTTQNITGEKTFVGSTKVKFKKNGSSDTLGFTCYDENGKEFANMQAKTRTVGGVSEQYLTLGNYADSTEGYGHGYVGFRMIPTNSYTYYNFVAPHGTNSQLSALYSSTANNYIPMAITDGNTTVKADELGVVNISSLMPSVPTSASTTVTLTPTTQTLIFTYEDDTTETITLLASVSASATTTLS